MAMHFNSSRGIPQKTRVVVGQLRRTQLITTFGSGAIADMPDYSVIIAATNLWKDGSPVLNEPNLEKLLKVSHFRQPYASDSEDGYAADIPAFRFPTMHFCPGCGKLMPFWAFGDEFGKTCKECNKRIVPSRFIAACINGHLEDFPYKWWVHGGDYTGCSAGIKDEKLKISFSEDTGGLESVIITCSACGRSRSMAGSMNRDALKGYKCRGKRPWLGMKADYDDKKTCKAPLRGMHRGASNVYFALTASALTIPPWSSKLSQIVGNKMPALEAFLVSKPAEDKLRAFVDGMFFDLIKNGKYTADDIIKEIRKREGSNRSDEYTKMDLYEDEYQTFCLRDYDDPNDVQFRLENTEVPELLEDYIDGVVMVRRLREVLALKGFRRIIPEKPDNNSQGHEGWHMEGDFIPLSDAPLGWYPGIEMLGEGIFLFLKEDALEKWEAKNAGFYEQMKSRLEESNVECDNFSPRYVLLHTLSHLLIRQLQVECGYSGAAIKERIYSTYPDSSMKMAGILLYTSSSDSDGSLGGLVRNALPERLELIFRNMLQDASWCSSDPICIESKSQGYDSLNYAACHACSLLPETSCEMRNCLLDRGAVVGSVFDRSRGYFGEIIDR